MKKNFILLLFAVLMVLSVTVSAEVIDGGEFYEGFTWSLDSDYVLTIEGEGSVKNLSANEQAPWYEYASDIKRVIVGEGVKSVGSNSFYLCGNLESVEFLNERPGVSSRCFFGCTNLKEVKSPMGIYGVGGEGFSGCVSLTEIKLHPQTSEIHSNAFKDCRALKSITIPATLSKLGSGAFQMCTSLESVVFEEDSALKTIEEGTFSDCSNLKSITIPKGVVDIENAVFTRCTSLESVVISSTVETIGNSCFVYCESLTRADIPSSVNKIGTSAFRKCDNLTIYTYAGSTAYAYAANNSIKREVYSEDESGIPTAVCGESASWSFNNGVMTVYGSGAVTGWQDSEYLKWSLVKNSVTSVIIEDGITSLPDKAFHGTKISSVVIKSAFIDLGTGTFSLCQNLAEVSLAEGVTAIGKELFAGCSSLTDITLPDTVTFIDEGAFRGCSALKKINIPYGITVIQNETFKGCKSLEEIYIPSSVKEFRLDAFLGCDGLKTVSAENLSAWCGMTFVGSGANPLTFADRFDVPENNRGEFVFPSTIKTIPDYAFYGSSYIRKIKFEGSLDSIGKSAFSGCNLLLEVDIPYGAGIIDKYAFSATDSLRRVSIKGDTQIAEYAFSGGKSLTELTLGEGVVSVGSNAFINCTALESVNLPSTLSSVGTCVFRGCSALKEITCDENNQHFSTDGVVLFNKDKTVIVYALPTITSYEIPDTVTGIADKAFFANEKLVSVYLPSEVSEIGSSVFGNCPNLTLYGYFGNVEIYARENGINFSPIKEDAVTVGLANFKKSDYDKTFTDVSRKDWFYNNVYSAASYNLMLGTSETQFSPDETLSLAQVITLAARLHSIYHTGKAEFVQGEVWYWVYLDYCIKNNIVSAGAYSNYYLPATRANFVTILAKAIPSSNFGQINSFKSIPDVSENDTIFDDVIMFYRAGILVGGDSKHTFSAFSTIKRSETAAIITRIVDPTLRIKVD